MIIWINGAFGAGAGGAEILHVFLDVDPAVLRQRITDRGTRQADSRTITRPGAGARSPASRPRIARAA
jgi:hypothetical protein